MSKWGKISYLVCGVSVLVLFTARLILQGWIDYFYIPLGLAGVTFILAIVLDYKFYFEVLTMRTTKHGMNLGALVLMALLLLVAINFLGVRFDKSFDLTKDKLNTLSDQTLAALKNLENDMQILIFYRGSDDKQLRGNLRENYQAYLTASPKVKLTFVDALVDVDMAKKYLGNDRFAVVVDYNGQKVKIDEPYGEEQTTSAILKASRKEQKSIYFLSGHGERDIDNNDTTGLHFLAEALRAEGFIVAKINLLTGDKLPSPPGVLAIVGPTGAFMDAELAKIREFAQAGGRIFLAIDPGEKHGLANLTKPLGVEFKNNYVINEFEELNQLGPLAALGAEYDRTSEITKGFYKEGRVMASVYNSASEVVRASEASADLVFREIVKSAAQAYTSNVPRAGKGGEKRAAVMALSVKGQLGAAPAEGKEKKPEFASVIFGDSDFLSNAFMRFGANKDLAINSVAFLADSLELISIRPKSPETTPLELTDTRQIIIITAGVTLPLVLIILSGFFWYRRRSL